MAKTDKNSRYNLLKKFTLRFIGVAVLVILVISPFIYSKNQGEISNITQNRSMLEILLKTFNAKRINESLGTNCEVDGCAVRSTASKNSKYIGKIRSKYFLNTIVMDKGFISYNRITEMWRGKTELVEAKLYTFDIGPIKLSPAARGIQKTAKIAISPEISISLVGSPEFAIKPPNTIKRRISNLSPAPFQWHVTPLSESKNAVLTLNVYLHLDEGEPHSISPTFTDTILIRVTRWQQTKDIVMALIPVWLFLAGAIPSFWGLYVFLRNRGWKFKKPVPKPKPPAPGRTPINKKKSD